LIPRIENAIVHMNAMIIEGIFLECMCFFGVAV